MVEIAYKLDLHLERTGVIVQRLPSGDEAVAVLHEHHLNVAGQLAGAWGNEVVAPPHETVVYMARNHDAGWPTYDRDPLLAPDRLPLDMPDMPPLVLTRIHDRSIRRNYLNHPYTGILGCCHTLGFYTGRRGVSDFLVHHMDDPPAELIPYLHEFERRRDAWIAELRDSGELTDQLEPDAIDRNYTALQVFDTLSLYFCSYRHDDPKPGSFPNVLGNDGSAITVELEPQADGELLVDPWPFKMGALRLVLDRKRVRTADSPRGTIEDAPTEQVVFTLRPR